MSNETKNKKNSKGIIVAVIAAVVVVGIIAFVLLRPKDSKDMETLGKKYYEESLHQTITIGSSNTEILERYTENGLQIPISEILKDSDMKESEIGKKVESSKCDLEKSVIKITPSEPFGVTDYKLEAIPSCE